MLKVEDIEQIRRAYYVEKKSIRAIGREQGHHRRVIREAIAGASPAPRRYRRQKPRPRTVVGPVAHLIAAWLEADREAPPKQRHSAKRIYDRLVAEHGYRGKERAIREYVHDWKAAQRSAGQGFVPLGYAPGAEAQCDWGEAVVRIGGVEQDAQVFCLRLCYSLKSFVCAFPAARQECFFAGHAAAFAFFGGVPRRITYDNLTSAVAKVLQGRHRVEQEAFVAFRGHYLFASHFCLPGQEGAHEKPLVESLVGYARRNFLVPVPNAASWEELNAQLYVRCMDEDGRPASGRGGTIGALWAEERAHLLPPQRHTYPCCRTVPVRATRQALVTFERNRYSVPTRYGGERLLLRAYAWEVEITDGQRVVARHPRLYGRDGEHLDPLHYLHLLERKPGAFDLARPIQQWARDWPPVYGQYLDALRQARPEGATREFVRILQLHVRYEVDVLAAALERALALGCWSADGVEQLVRQALAPPERPLLGAEMGSSLGPLPEVTIPLPDLHRFDGLLREREVGSCP
jgi:transposase